MHTQDIKCTLLNVRVPRWSQAIFVAIVETSKYYYWHDKPDVLTPHHTHATAHLKPTPTKPYLYSNPEQATINNDYLDIPQIAINIYSVIETNRK